MKISALILVMILQCVYTKKIAHVIMDNSKRSDPELEELRKLVAELSRHVMMQQQHVEEITRAQGSSGIQLVRGVNRGLKNYEFNNHLSPAAFNMHDHSNYDRTVGIGEFSATLNGILFRTRHNDYKLVMPSRTSKEYNAFENIPFPDVPPEVLKQPTVQDQVLEMIEWFKAFNNQDRSKRDYTKYFKPVLCYLEGTWTLDKDLVEPFESDRHNLEAKSWLDLYGKNRFAAYTGTKNRQENIAYLPTSIMSVNMATGESQYAQWNYRIICHPIGYDIPLHLFQQEDDLSFRIQTGQTLTRTHQSRVARYKLFDPTRKSNYQILDSIFAAIPGKDNYGANLTFTNFGDDMLDTAFSDNKHVLNMGYYQRSYKSVKAGAGGITFTAMGFNDENLWVAKTTQPRVAPLQTEECTKVHNKQGRLSTHCSPAEIRVSYAIPLEVIFMTPLLSWNPYNIVFHEDSKTAGKDGRTGAKPETALNGIDKARFYKTPAEFFTGPLDLSDKADTVKSFLYVLNQNGEVKKVSSSGIRILLQDIGGTGKIRLRYPIAPVHYEGSSVWKELNALKDKDFQGAPTTVEFVMSVTVEDPPGEHTHEFKLTYEEFTLLQAGEQVKVVTDEAQEHTHELVITFDYETKSFSYVSCDEDDICWDGHPRSVVLETKNEFTQIH